MTQLLVCNKTNMGIQTQSADFSKLLNQLNITEYTTFVGNNDDSLFAYENTNLKVQKKVSELRQNNETLVCLTEDHSLVSGIFSNLPTNSAMVYIDAHTDFHSRETSSSKRPHGMSLGSLMGLDVEALKGKINPENLIILSVNSYEQEELDNLKQLSISNVFSFDDDRNCFCNIFNNEVKNLIEIIHLINQVQKRTTTMGLSLDLDALSVKEFNGAYYQTGNLPLHTCMDILNATKHFYSIFEITELNVNDIFNNISNYTIFNNLFNIIYKQSTDQKTIAI